MSLPVMVIGVDCRLPDNRVAYLSCELTEIVQRDDPDVGGIVPGVGQLFIFWRHSLQQELQPDSIVAEIGKTDDDLPADPGKGAEQRRRFQNLLQGLAQDDVVETAVGIIIDLGIQVALKHAQASGDAGCGFARIPFYSGSLHAFVGGKPGQKIAVAAAEVENPASLGDPGGYDLEVIAHFGGFRQVHREILAPECSGAHQG